MKRMGCVSLARGLRGVSTIHRSNLPSIEEKLNTCVSVSKFFRERCEIHAKRVAFVDGVSSREVTFSQAFERSEQLAAVLYRRFNIRQGDIVSFVSPNTVDYVSVFQAVLLLGGVISPVSPAFSGEEIAKHIQLAGSKLVISYQPFKAATEQASNITGVPLLLADEPLGSNLPLRSSEVGETKMDDVVVLPFSSGTTGLPKGVELTNRNLLANLFQFDSFDSILKQDQTDVIMAVLPYFHIYGMVVVMMGPLSAGAKQIVVPRFNLVQYIELIEKHKATTLYVAPPMLLELKNRAGEFPSLKSMSHIRYIMSGAAPLTKTLHRSIEDMFPHTHILQGYGLTETSPVITVTKPGSMLYESAGSLFPDTELRIVDTAEDPQHAQDPPSGQPGEIWVRGPQVMRGYANIDNSAVFEKGWFRTGDIGLIDSTTNALHITDRLKELIKCKGFQVPPAELEALIMTLPFVKDVVVFGVRCPDKIDEWPVASVVLDTDEPQLTENHKQSIVEFVALNTPTYKQLKGGVHVVSTIPKSLSGKVLRRIAKQRYMDSLPA